MTSRTLSMERLSPAYFGLVMATGIVSLAAHVVGMPRTASVLFALNGVFYVVLWALNVIRAVTHTRAFASDLVDHLRGPGFFTWVAATGVLGAQFVILLDNYRVAWALWGLAAALWAALTYSIFTIFTVKEEKPPLERGISGAWLLAVVATQSIAVLSALLAMREAAAFKRELNFLALCLWLWGGMLYIWMMSLIFYRYTFFRLAPGDLTPPYWINMGAMAISTLAGSHLMTNAGDAQLLQQLQPFVMGFTIFYWATGTWWIPMLLLLGVWRYVYKRHPLRYDPLYWGAVFPLGMYAVATHHMAAALGLPLLAGAARLFAYVALAAWAAAAAGLVRTIWRAAAGRPA